MYSETTKGSETTITVSNLIRIQFRKFMMLQSTDDCMTFFCTVTFSIERILNLGIKQDSCTLLYMFWSLFSAKADPDDCDR